LPGLFDADGTVAISIGHSTVVTKNVKATVTEKLQKFIESGSHNQIYLKVPNRYESNVRILFDAFKFGTIRSEKANRKTKKPNINFYWEAKTEKDVLRLCDYLRLYPCKSTKRHRISLVRIYLHYKKQKYHLIARDFPNSFEGQKWEKFCKSWFKYSF
jgi:hypothetical protein